MLNDFETTEFRTIFKTDDLLNEVEIRCKKVKKGRWVLTIHVIPFKNANLTLHDKAQAISEILAKEGIDVIIYEDYNTKFEISGKLTVEEVVIQMSKKI